MKRYAILVGLITAGVIIGGAGTALADDEVTPPSTETQYSHVMSRYDDAAPPSTDVQYSHVMVNYDNAFYS